MYDTNKQIYRKKRVMMNIYGKKVSMSIYRI